MNFAVGLLIVAAFVCPTLVAQNHGCVDVPAPNAEAAGKVRDASQWQNPYLVVYPKWIELITGIARVKEDVPLSELENTLRSLPATKWPYGRIVAVQEAGVRSGLPRDDKLILQNEKIVEKTLMKHCIRVSRWPS